MRRWIPLETAMICAVLTGVIRADDDEKLVPSITVVGAGEVQVRPDTANVTVGVTTEAESASRGAQREHGADDRIAQDAEGTRHR